MGIDANQADYARIRGRSSKWVELQRKAGLPYTGSGRKGDAINIDTEKAIEWEIAQAVSKYKVISEGADELSHAEAQRLKTIAEYRQRDVDASLAEGLAINTDKVVRLFDEFLVMFASQSEAIGGRLANQLAAESNAAIIRDTIQDETRRIRTNLSRHVNDVLAAGRAAVSTRAAAEPGGLAMGGSEARTAEGQRRTGTVSSQPRTVDQDTNGAGTRSTA